MLLNPMPITAMRNGRPSPYSQAWIYEDGSDTLTAVYADAALSDALTNPVISDAFGQFPQIHTDDTVLCRIVVTDQEGDTASPLYAADSVGGGARPSSPVDAETGSSYVVTTGDAGRIKKRTHNASMTDTLPGAATAGNGYRVMLWNATTTRTLTVSVAGSGTIDSQSSLVLQPGQRTWFISDGTDEYTADLPSFLTGYVEVPFPAGALVPRTTAGATYSKIETGSVLNNYDAYLFDDTTEETVDLPLTRLPGWDGTAIYAMASWSNAAGTLGQGVTWAFAMRALANGSGLDAALGTEATVSDAYENAGAVHNTSTVAVTPASAVSGTTLIQGKIARKPSDGSDTLTGDARLIGVSLFYRKNTSAESP